MSEPGTSADALAELGRLQRENRDLARRLASKTHEAHELRNLLNCIYFTVAEKAAAARALAKEGGSP